MLGTNLPHSWKTVGKQTAPVQAVVIQWNEDLLGANWTQKAEFVNIRKLLRLSERGIKFSAATSGRFACELTQLPGLPPFEKLLSLLKILHELASDKAYTLLSSSSFDANLSAEDSGRISVIQAHVKTTCMLKLQWPGSRFNRFNRSFFLQVL